MLLYLPLNHTNSWVQEGYPIQRKHKHLFRCSSNPYMKLFFRSSPSLFCLCLIFTLHLQIFKCVIRDAAFASAWDQQKMTITTLLNPYASVNLMQNRKDIFNYFLSYSSNCLWDWAFPFVLWMYLYFLITVMFSYQILSSLKLSCMNSCSVGRCKQETRSGDAAVGNSRSHVLHYSLCFG